jgi:ppGpp synthetase/RelA/SpoT-type nucleotidyltranferase
MTNTFSKNQVRKLGDELRQDLSKPSEKSILKLQEYRTSHKESLANIFSTLYQVSTNIRPDSIVTYRIKRIESILGKLGRYPKMEFDRMWDIAGCRCIVPNRLVLAKVLKRIEKSCYVRDIRNYHSDPQPSGYRSIHLYVSCKESDKEVVELQLRTVDEHNWATLVEIIDFLYDKKLKEGEKDADLEDFHLLLSRKESLTYVEKKRVLDVVIKFDIYNKLSSVFVKNYLNVRRQWLDINRNESGSFYIIEARKDDSPLINCFKNFNDAEAAYLEKFRLNTESNIVLTYLPRANFERIGKAYSNYILTMHTFLDDCCSLLEDLVYSSIEARSLSMFRKYYTLYVKTMAAHIEDIEEEAKSIEELLRVRKRSKEVKYWQSDFRRMYERRGNEISRLNLKWNKVYPKSGLYKWIFNLMTNRIVDKYKAS